MSTGRLGRRRAALADDLLERPALDVLHRDVVGAVPLAAVEDADDVRVLQAGGARRLAAEALDELLVLGEAAVEQLERDAAAELLVLGAVDVGHAAGAEPLDDAVAAVDERVAARRSPSAAHPSASSTSAAIGAATAPPVPPLHALDHDRDGDLGR